VRRNLFHPMAFLMLAQMRPKLLHPPRQRPHERRRRRRRDARIERARIAVAPQTSAPIYDPAIARVREAGGPIDNASYSCACGCVFSAAVSTTVACPHCGAGQAW
jgi:hypothetical protein